MTKRAISLSMTLCLALGASFAPARDPATRPARDPAAVALAPATKPTTRPGAEARRPSAPRPEAARFEVVRKVDAPKPDPSKPVKDVPPPPNRDVPPVVQPPKIDVKVPATAPAGAAALASRPAKKDVAQVAYIDLDRPVGERPAPFVLFADPTVTVQSVLSRLHKARDDKNVRAVLITIGNNSGFNLAQAQEMRDALTQLRNAGKRTFVYADGYDTAAYVMASGATDVCLLEGGEIMIPGVGIETMFAKGLLDKVGVKADYVQIGEYKGADEQFTRTEASKELKGELGKLVDNLYAQIVDGIAHHRNLPPSRVQDMIDDSIVMAKVAKERGFIDHMVDPDGLRDLLTKELGRPVELAGDYGQPQREQMDFSNPFALMASLAKKKPDSDKPAIALIYAEGMIVDGTAGDSLFGGDATIGSDDMRRAFRMALRDDKVKAIVLRIDSPGGSALASEAIWQAARRAAKEKPLIISIGSMAASGGYYIAAAGDRIFADPTAIVGSIGVVGGKFVLKDLFEKVGISTEAFSKGKNANLFSSNTPWSDTQRRMVTNWMKQTYDQFTTRVMSTRKGKIKDIDEVARGRIFIAKQARDLGMVDQLGGVTDALNYAAGEADLQKNEYDIKVFPQQRTLGDLLRGAGGAEAMMPVRPNMAADVPAFLYALSPANARLVKQQLQMIRLLQERPVMLVAPFSITVQ